MREIADFSDGRQKAWCINCARPLVDAGASRDHAPTKTLLCEPYPANLPIVFICPVCNKGFSESEQYTVAFLSSVVCGSTDPASQRLPGAARILSFRNDLRKKIEGSITNTAGRTTWNPDFDLMHPALIKNARGHAMYEYGEPMLEEPAHVAAVPLVSLDLPVRSAFEDVGINAWPEVGSRMMQRILTGEDLVDGWAEIQQGVYRYAIVQSGLLTVRMVLLNYLAVEVIWN